MTFGAEMRVGELVSVKTKHYGTLIGLVVKRGMDGYFIRAANHSRVIIAQPEDLEVINESR